MRAPTSMRWAAGPLTSIAWALAGLGGVVAQTPDIARATCADLLRFGRPERLQLVIWLHGYYAGAAQRTTLDPARFDEAAARLQQACDRDATLPLIGAEMRGIFLGETAPPASAAPPGPGTAAPTAPSRPLPAR